MARTAGRQYGATMRRLDRWVWWSLVALAIAPAARYGTARAVPRRHRGRGVRRVAAVGGCTVGAGLAGGGPSPPRHGRQPRRPERLLHRPGTSNTGRRAAPRPGDRPPDVRAGRPADGRRRRLRRRRRSRRHQRRLRRLRRRRECCSTRQLSPSRPTAPRLRRHSTQDAISILQRDPATGALRRSPTRRHGAARGLPRQPGDGRRATAACSSRVGPGSTTRSRSWSRRTARSSTSPRRPPATEAIGVLGRTPGTGQIQAMAPDPSLATVRGCIAAGGGGGAAGRATSWRTRRALALAPDGTILYQAGPTAPPAASPRMCATPRPAS